MTGRMLSALKRTSNQRLRRSLTAKPVRLTHLIHRLRSIRSVRSIDTKEATREGGRSKAEKGKSRNGQATTKLH